MRDPVITISWEGVASSDVVATTGESVAAATGATVLLSNHSEFDQAFNKNRMLAGRGNGPHPYELGAEWVQRYFQVMQGCARAAQLGLEQKLADARKR